MKHYKCFLGMLACLDREVPIFTRGFVVACLIMPYVLTGLYLGRYYLVDFIMITMISVVMITITMLLYSEGIFLAIYEQTKSLPSALKKCKKCIEGVSR